MADASPMVMMEGVGKVYGNKIQTRVLWDINFRVERGEFAAIVGPSGSGKSTLLNLIGALDKPSEGEVRISGESLGTLDDEGLARLRRQYVGFIFQFHYLLPDFTALENVLMPFYVAHSTPTKQEVKEAKELMERVGLKDRMNNRATDLSGGSSNGLRLPALLRGVSRSFLQMNLRVISIHRRVRRFFAQCAILTNKTERPSCS